MARKRREGITTGIRYRIKMLRVMGVPVPQEWAEEYAMALLQARSTGYGPFKTAWEEVKPVLMRERVPSALHGLYKAFTNEVISKVQQKKISDLEDLIDKWTKLGLDPHVLQVVGETVVRVIAPETPQPPPKGA
jgi:hypothetical protein